MIVGRDFIWLHFPKCAGTETEAILRRKLDGDPAVAFDAIDPARVIWHHAIPERRQFDPGFDPAGREVICNIRRLPEWVLSRVHAGHISAKRFPVTREMVVAGRFHRQDGRMLSADDVMRRFTAHPVDRWIRTEHFAADFAAAFAPHLPPDGISPAAEMRHANTSRIDYIRDRNFWFTPAEIVALYAANPFWAKIECQVYGAGT